MHHYRRVRLPYILSGERALLTERNEGMGQLGSPAPSARSLASWLIQNLHDPRKPLATVALLISEYDLQPFRNPRTGEDHPVEVASVTNAKVAVREWGARGQRAGDRLLFYFCGHGIANGTKSLCYWPISDRAHITRWKPRSTLITSGLVWRRSPRGTVFLRRRLPGELRNGARGERLHGGSYILARYHESTCSRPSAATVSCVLFHYPGRGRLRVSWSSQPFTDALVRALNGAGSDDNEGDWRVSTTGLKRAIDFFMDRAFQAGAFQVQVPATNNLTTFFLHYLDCKPMAHVFVGCRPEMANALADLLSPGGGDSGPPWAGDSGGLGIGPAAGRL